MESKNQTIDSKEKQREALKEMMRLDEDMGLYDEPNEDQIREPKEKLRLSANGDVYVNGKLMEEKEVIKALNKIFKIE